MDRTEAINVTISGVSNAIQLEANSNSGWLLSFVDNSVEIAATQNGKTICSQSNTKIGAYTLWVCIIDRLSKNYASLCLSLRRSLHPTPPLRLPLEIRSLETTLERLLSERSLSELPLSLSKLFLETLSSLVSRLRLFVCGAVDV